MNYVLKIVLSVYQNFDVQSVYQVINFEKINIIMYYVDKSVQMVITKNIYYVNYVLIFVQLVNQILIVHHVKVLIS